MGWTESEIAKARTARLPAEASEETKRRRDEGWDARMAGFPLAADAHSDWREGWLNADDNLRDD